MRHIYGKVFENSGQPIFFDIFLKLRPEIKVTHRGVQIFFPVAKRKPLAVK